MIRNPRIASTKESLQEAADWTYDQIAAEQHPKSPRPRLRWSKRRGHAQIYTGSISIPKWCINQGPYYMVSYVVHETMHLFEPGHGQNFAAVEEKALALWGLKPTKRGGRNNYVKALASSDGQVWTAPASLLDRPRRKRSEESKLASLLFELHSSWR